MYILYELLAMYKMSTRSQVHEVYYITKLLIKAHLVHTCTVLKPTSPIPSHCAVIILIQSVPVNQLSRLAL